MTDGLTGLGNRRALESWQQARARSGAPIALVQVDLDFFKAVNDSYGHGVGDAVLQAAADRIRTALRPSDDVARTGGDEFVALLDWPGGIDDLEALARRVIEDVERPIRVDGTTCRISASVGVAMSARYAEPTLEQMLSDADEALYAAKRAGRGQVRVHAA